MTCKSEKLVHFLSLSPDLTKSVAYLEPYTNPDYESTFFNCTIPNILFLLSLIGKKVTILLLSISRRTKLSI